MAGLGVLGAATVLFGASSGVLWWFTTTQHLDTLAQQESSDAAREATEAMLSYRVGSAEQDLLSARDRLTGGFVDTYTNLVKTVVVPGSKEKQISSAARVAAIAPISTNLDRAVLLLFINQAITVGSDPPTESASSVRVSLEKVNRRWLVSGFDPV